ncbi:aminotransferase class III-fold pyridoxal phosphate-dependent enzyme, partial [Algoriphagus sp. AGSA1]|nr:aminotransferase class III-fold pyridoxal phosphate-dependent enzyme [Algoriphagus sp. AGSA1]
LESNVRAYCRAYPAVFDKALNARQWDENGVEFIDVFAGAGVLNYGHNNERQRQAIIDYMLADGVTHSLDLHTTAKRTFIERFEDIILKPRKLEYKLQFTGPTGTNVVEAALKLARKVTGRSTVAAFTNGFHGMTLGALAVTGNAHYRNVSGVALNVVLRLPFEGYAGTGVGSLDMIRQTLADSSSGVEAPAAFLVETVQAEGALFIIDDIQLGNGRTGHFFSWEDMGLDPDLVCLAKGIGGFGTPMGLLLIRPELDQWSPGDHTGTFRGQNLSFVAGSEALAYYENDDFLKSVQEKGRYMEERLNNIVANHKKLNFEVRGRGMMQGLDTHSPAIAKKIMAAAAKQRVIVGACGTDGRV